MPGAEEEMKQEEFDADTAGRKIGKGTESSDDGYEEAAKNSQSSKEKPDAEKEEEQVRDSASEHSEGTKKDTEVFRKENREGIKKMKGQMKEI